jgi:hypothetical protein
MTTPQWNDDTQRRIRAERKYNDLLAAIAKAVVIELRAAKYIEIHDQLPTSSPSKVPTTIPERGTNK